MKYIAAAAVLGLAGVASADFNPQVQEFDFEGGAFETSFMFMKAGEFSDLPLKAVKFEIEITVNGGNFVIDNDGESLAQAEISVNAGALTSSDLLLPALNPQASFMQMVTDLAADDEHPGGPAVFTNDGGPDVVQLDAFDNQMEMDMANFTEDAFLDQFAGLGIFDIGVAVSQNILLPAVGSIATSVTTANVEGTVRITYLYAPAPGAMALMGLAGFAATRRRRA